MNKLEEILDINFSEIPDIYEEDYAPYSRKEVLEAMKMAYQLGRINTANWIVKNVKVDWKDYDEVEVRESSILAAITTKDLDI